MMVLSKLQAPGRPTIWMIVGQGPSALAVGAGGACLDNFTLFFLTLSGGTARYSLKYCLEGPLSPTQHRYENLTKIKTKRNKIINCKQNTIDMKNSYSLRTTFIVPPPPPPPISSTLWRLYYTMNTY